MQLEFPKLSLSPCLSAFVILVHYLSWERPNFEINSSKKVELGRNNISMIRAVCASKVSFPA